MWKILPEIARFRKPGTQIKHIRGHYYLTKVTSKWDPVAKKVRKVYQGHLGVVTQDGVVPRRSRRRPVDADWLYVTALLRCVRHCAMRYTEHFYDVSYLSERFPGLNLSSLNLSNLMTGLGFRRVQMVAFMREFIPDRNAYMLFDGTAMVCNSLNIYEAQRGYNSHGCHDPQINLMYAAAISGEKLMPVFYKRFPGSIRDLSAFENMRNEMGAKNFIAINDKGFVKARDQARMDDSRQDGRRPRCHDACRSPEFLGRGHVQRRRGQQPGDALHLVRRQDQRQGAHRRKCDLDACRAVL